jgi:hypothetical protein
MTAVPVRPITRTVLTVEVVHRSDRPVPTLTDVLEAVSEGLAIGTTTSKIVEPLSVDQVDDALRKLGANGAYFDDYLNAFDR